MRGEVCLGKSAPCAPTLATHGGTGANRRGIGKTFTSTHPSILPSSFYSSDQHLLRPTLHKALCLALRTCAKTLSCLGCTVDTMTPETHCEVDRSPRFKCLTEALETLANSIVLQSYIIHKYRNDNELQYRY